MTIFLSPYEGINIESIFFGNKKNSILNEIEKKFQAKEFQRAKNKCILLLDISTILEFNDEDELIFIEMARRKADPCWDDIHFFSPVKEIIKMLSEKGIEGKMISKDVLVFETLGVSLWLENGTQSVYSTACALYKEGYYTGLL